MSTITDSTPFDLQGCVDRIQEYADVIESMLKDYRLPDKFGAETEAWLLGKLALRTIHGVIALARQDVVLLPGANTMARYAAEVATRMMWIVFPEYEWDRESRLVAHMMEEAKSFYNTTALLTQMGIDAKERWLKSRTLVDGCWSRAKDVSSSTLDFLKGIPSEEAMLEEIIPDREDLAYRIGHGYLHPRSVAARLYCWQTGEHLEVGEFVSPRKWIPVFEIAAFALRAMDVAIVYMEDPNRVEEPPDFCAGLDEAIAEIIGPTHQIGDDGTGS